MLQTLKKMCHILYLAFATLNLVKNHSYVPTFNIHYKETENIEIFRLCRSKDHIKKRR